MLNLKTKDYCVPRDVEITAEILNQFLMENRNRIAKRYKRLADAYETKYCIFTAPKKEAWKPDNRIAVNFAKYIVDTMNGFFMGVPVKVTSDDERTADYINKVDAYNDTADLNAELAKRCDIFGKAYEMYYVDPNGEISIAVFDPLNAFMIYDDTITRRRRAFVHVYVDAENVTRGSISNERTVRYFRVDPSFMWEDKEQAHGFDGVPAVEYVENDEQQGLFEPVLSMIDAYNKAISEKANDVDYFADAYLKVLGAPINDEDLPWIRNNRVINFEGDGAGNIDVDFLTKPSGDETQEHLLDRLYHQIFTVSMVADLSDENFGGASGIALKYKLLAMNNLRATKERKFKAGMVQRYKLIFSNPVSGMGADDWVTIRYKFTPNFPANIQEEAEIAAKLAGVVSTETQLSTLSIVDDVQAEKDRLEEDERGLLADSQALREVFGVNNGT